MSTYQDIKSYATINPTDPKKVNQLTNSILTNGWQGDPILYCNLGLITGSHRLTALHQIAKLYPDHDILTANITIDVTDEINDYCADHDICYDEIDFRLISEHLGYGPEGD